MPWPAIDAGAAQGLLGKGRFGKVYQCKKKDTGRVYAIKALLKSHILSSEAQRILVEREKSILQKINNPFLVRCYHIFEDAEKLYFVMGGFGARVGRVALRSLRSRRPWQSAPPAASCLCTCRVSSRSTPSACGIMVRGVCGRIPCTAPDDGNAAQRRKCFSVSSTSTAWALCIAI